MSTSKQTPILQALAAALKSGSARQRTNGFYNPRPQEYFAFAQDGTWTPASSRQAPTLTSTSPLNRKAIRLISWNIDMIAPFGNERMSAAIQYLHTLISSSPLDTATIIFLQEMTSADLTLIASSPWIRSRFNITDKDSSCWLSPNYGTTTLIDARLQIESIFRVPFLSKFNRDGLFVDIALSLSSSTSNGSSALSKAQKTLRLCNVHLESLVADPPIRPSQLSAAAAYLCEPNVACALLAGDLNAIEPFDRALHTSIGLKDAYLSLGGQEDREEGYTWGYQVPAWTRGRFGCSRMDKMLFCGDMRVEGFERIGLGAKIAEDKREKTKEADEEQWISDHYGIMGDFELSNEWTLRAE